MITDENIKEVLLKENYISDEDFQRIEKATKGNATKMVEIFLAEGIVTKELMAQAIAEFYNLPYGSILNHRPSREQILKIPEAIAKKYRVTLLKEEDKKITVVTSQPNEKALIPALKKLFKGKTIKLAYDLDERLNELFISYKKGISDRFESIIKKQERIAPQMINEIIEDAVAYKTSDIHLEPQEEEVVVRFRIDGVLHEMGRIPKQYYANIVNRIKIQSHLQIDEHFAAQDGVMRYKTEVVKIDMRVSIIPILDGEKIVIRLLSKQSQELTLNDLGLSSNDESLILQASNKPFGMILVTGPTGSGKTTTLYGLLKILNKPGVNIATIEDPAEYKIQGVNHIQVNEKTNLTFAEGLRSIVRQDPDIILVGEIRDTETVEIAVNAALTGHLLLSTFHSNDAATAVPRLLDMGIEPFLLSSTLELVAAQRLARRICTSCKFGQKYTHSQLKSWLSDPKKYFSGKSATLYAGKGCEACNHTGYNGRIAIYEFLPTSEAMRELILNNPSTQQIRELAKKEGVMTMLEDGIEKVKNGLTTLEEIVRVVGPK